MCETASFTNLDQKDVEHFLPSTSNMVMLHIANKIKTFSTNPIHDPEIIYLFKLGNNISKESLDAAHLE